MEPKDRDWLASYDARGCLDKVAAEKAGVNIYALVQERWVYNAGPLGPSQWDLRITERGIAALKAAGVNTDPVPCNRCGGTGTLHRFPDGEATECNKCHGMKWLHRSSAKPRRRRVAG